MICSLNEIEALSRKAARGGGMSWGLAEETGKAVRWLSHYGLPGSGLLAELLRRNDGTPYRDLAPERSGEVLRALSGPLCPIIAGALICDRADDLKQGAALRLEEVALPLLLAPFASEAARAAKVSVALTWPGMSLLLDGGAPRLDGDDAALHVAKAGSVALSPADPRMAGVVRTHSGCQVTAETYRTLESFAYRTYAPATEASRAGAGAGRESD